MTHDRADTNDAFGGIFCFPIPDPPAKSGQLHRDLTEQCRHRTVSVILHTANTIAARAISPPDPVVRRLRGRDLSLDACQQHLRVGQGQPPIGDVTKAIRPPDLHEIRAWILTLGAGFHQPQNPSHAPTPSPRTGAKIPNPCGHPQFRDGPAANSRAISTVILRRQAAQDCYS
jgi:hypothetical protein